MATETVLQIYPLIKRLEQNVHTYVESRGTRSSILYDNVHCLKKWVEEHIEISAGSQSTKVIEDVGKVILTTIEAITDLRSRDDKKLVKACLNIMSSVVALLSGPYGGVSGAMCGILCVVLSANAANEPDVTTQLVSTVQDELKKFTQDLNVKRFTGFHSRINAINMDLKGMIEACVIGRKAWWLQIFPTPENPSTTNMIPDKDLLGSAFPQFVAEVGSTFEKGIPYGSSAAEVSGGLSSILIYCNAQALFIILLTHVLATYETTGRDTEAIKKLLDAQKGDAHRRLGDFSDTEFAFSSESVSNQIARLWMIFYLRQNKEICEKVETFRLGLNMKPMPSLAYALQRASWAYGAMPNDISDYYPEPHTKGKNHYFQFINHTDFPVKVICGMGGDYVNGLKFKKCVDPRSSYEHPAATDLTWTFSTAGYFVIFLDGVLTSLDDIAYENRSLRAFEFALSNPLLGSRKMKVKYKSWHLSDINVEECWEEMTDLCARCPPIYFDYGGKQYVVYGDITPVLGHGTRNKNNVGKNGCETWRFVVQDFNPADAGYAM